MPSRRQELRKVLQLVRTEALLLCIYTSVLLREHCWGCRWNYPSLCLVFPTQLLVCSHYPGGTFLVNQDCFFKGSILGPHAENLRILADTDRTGLWWHSHTLNESHRCNVPQRINSHKSMYGRNGYTKATISQCLGKSLCWCKKLGQSYFGVKVFRCSESMVGSSLLTW